MFTIYLTSGESAISEFEQVNIYLQNWKNALTHIMKNIMQ